MNPVHPFAFVWVGRSVGIGRGGGGIVVACSSTLLFFLKDPPRRRRAFTFDTSLNEAALALPLKTEAEQPLVRPEKVAPNEGTLYGSGDVR